MASAGEPPEAGKPPEDTKSTSEEVRRLPPPVTRPFDVRLHAEPLTKPFDVRRHKEETASGLAWGLLFVFAGVIGAALLYAFVEDKDGAVDLAVTLLPYTGTPLAVALGYYFGISARR